MTNIHGKDGLRVLVTMASAIIVIAGLKAAQDVLLPIVLATFLAIASYPITRMLRDKFKFPHWLAVFFTVLVDFSFLVGLGFLTNYLAGDLATIWADKYQPLLVEKYGEFHVFLQRNNWDLQARKTMESMMDVVNGQHIVNMATVLMGKAAAILTVTTLVLILMTFFLGEAPRFYGNVNRISEKNGPGIHKFLKALSGVQKYLVIKTIISFTTGVLAWALCCAVGVDLPLLWGIVAFALNFIPTFGSIVAAIPPVILSLMTLGVSESAIVALGYLAINTALGNLIEPMLMGRQFGIATSVVLLSVVTWGWIWGPIGMLLAVPITMLVKLALESSRDLKWIAMMIDNPPKKRNIKIPVIDAALKSMEESVEKSVEPKDLGKSEK